MSMEPERLRRCLVELFFNRQRRLARCQAGPIADPEDMRIDGEGFGTKSDVHHDIGSLAADTRQCFERITVWWHLAAMVSDQRR